MLFTNELFVEKAERDTIKEEKNTLRQIASADIKVSSKMLDNYRVHTENY